MTTSNMLEEQAQVLLEEIATWKSVTTIVIHAGCVFEFKGPFPKGTTSHGYYNLEGEIPGFHGHLKLEGIQNINFQDSPHRGQESYAFVFEAKENEIMFKIFLGRDQEGTLFPEQVAYFKQVQQQFLEAQE